MNKKSLIFSVIFVLALSFMSFSYGTNIIMDLNNSNNTDTNNSTITNDVSTDTTNANSTTVDNTIYSSDTGTTQTSSSDLQEPITTATTNYDESGDLTIGNIINIVLIVVGIVLILLGIAIIIRLK